MQANLPARKLISFCLFGDNPLYLEGALQNIALAPEIYPGWECLFYVSNKLDPEFLKRLQSRSCKVQVVDDNFSTDREQLINAMYWRLFALARCDMSHVIFRDCDSRISHREAVAVEAWLASGKDFHFMYDHPYHTVPILGGMWGYRGRPITDIQARIEHFRSSLHVDASYHEQSDQAFLRAQFWSTLAGSSNYLAHGEIANCEYHLNEGIVIEPFPAVELATQPPQSTPRFIGQTIQVPGGRQKTAKV